jgi:hypothetical protein
MRSSFERGSPCGGGTCVRTWPGTTISSSVEAGRRGAVGEGPDEGGAATCGAATGGAAGCALGCGVGAAGAARGCAIGAGAGAGVGGGATTGAGAGVVTTGAGAGAGGAATGGGADGERDALRPAGSNPAHALKLTAKAIAATRPIIRLLLASPARHLTNKRDQTATISATQAGTVSLARP